MTEEKKTPTIEFAPGCFDNFDGTQEELDELIAQITAMATNGELADASTELSEDEWDELPDDVKESIIRAVEGEESDVPPRTLQ
jgi:hypothetical protein